ncbi:MAG TPA: phage terminase large subunit family protein [Myxococcota bacterium]|nr:phage terminase large subunit family protein [Myxococcota bacterium]
MGAPEHDLVSSLFRAYLRPRESLTVDAWADRCRVLAGETSAEPGPWRTDRTPYLRQIMEDLSDDAQYEEVVLQFGTQLGKSESGLNWIGYCIDHDPGPMMLILPTVDIAKRFSKQRLAPMVRETPTLRARIRDSRSRDSGNTTLVKEFPGGLLVVTGANSAAGLASMPSRVLYADEVDDYPDDVDGQGEPLGLATARQDTFARRKRLLSSSPKRPPGLSTIEARFHAGTRFRYEVPCPHCRAFQVLEWGGKEVPHGLKWIGNEPSTAHYVCRHCGVVIEEHAKAAMLAGGRWAAENPLAAVRSYHLSSLYSPLGWLSWATIVREFLEAAAALVDGKTAPMKTWRNTRLALTWAEPGARLQVHALKERAQRAGAHRLRDVPAPVAILTAGVDVQDNRVEVSVWGWGPGEECALVDHQVIPGDPAQDDLWLRMDDYLATRFRHAGGGTIGVEAVALDTGGHFTHTVYSYVRARSPGRRIDAGGQVWVQRVYAVKGQDRPGLPVKGKGTSVDVNYRGKMVQRGVQLWMVGVNSAKDWLYARLRQERAGPGYVHLPADVTEEWCEQMTVESRVQARTARGIRMVWKCPPGKRNEAWDCAVYALFAAHAIGVERMTAPMWQRLADRIAPTQGDLPSAPDAPRETRPEPDDDPPRAPETPRIPLRPRLARSPGGWMSKLG